MRLGQGSISFLELSSLWPYVSIFIWRPRFSMEDTLIRKCRRLTEPEYWYDWPATVFLFWCCFWSAHWFPENRLVFLSLDNVQCLFICFTDSCTAFWRRPLFWNPYQRSGRDCCWSFSALSSPGCWPRIYQTALSIKFLLCQYLFMLCMVSGIFRTLRTTAAVCCFLMLRPCFTDVFFTPLQYNEFR